MRFVLCIVIAALLPASALAASNGAAMSLSRAQAAAEKGDQKAAAAVATTTDRESCMSGCANRGHSKSQCISACRRGLCRRRTAVLRVEVAGQLISQKSTNELKSNNTLRQSTAPPGSFDFQIAPILSVTK